MLEKDDLDLLLDSALRTYADPGPDAGLDQRVLARLSAETASAPRRRWLPWAWLPWGVALPAAACLLLFVFSGPKTTNSPSGAARGTARESADATARTEMLPPPRSEADNTESPVPKARPRPVSRAAQSVSLPKLDIFPTPRPLTPAERILVDFATHAPESERRSLIAAQEQADAPLSIAAIEIQPLKPPDEGTN